MGGRYGVARRLLGYFGWLLGGWKGVVGGRWGVLKNSNPDSNSPTDKKFKSKYLED